MTGWGSDTADSFVSDGLPRNHLPGKTSPCARRARPPKQFSVMSFDAQVTSTAELAPACRTSARWGLWLARGGRFHRSTPFRGRLGWVGAG